MKFYYNNELVRTSKHAYTHAVLVLYEDGTFKVAGCRTSKDACEAIIRQEINYAKQAIQNYNSLAKAIKEGKKKYGCKEGRRTYYLPVEDSTVEQCNERIAGKEEYIDFIEKHWKVVELEARA